MNTYQEVLDFWFITLGSPKEWFMSGIKYDKIISDKFSTLLEKAIKGELNNWMENNKSCLALIIILDQFSRHINRGTKGAYSQDNFAISIVKKKLRYILSFEGWTKVFFLMPLQHSENLDDHKILRNVYDSLIQKAIGIERDILKKVDKHVRGHYNVIVEFGRFPMRNKVLNRQNRKNEELYISFRTTHY